MRFTPINLANLKGVFTREANAISSTEFSFSRFLTPYLSDYAGWSMFIDCDMLARADVADKGWRHGWDDADQPAQIRPAPVLVAPRGQAAGVAGL